MPTARYDLAAAAGADGQIYVFGGDNGSAILSTVQAYNPATNSWTTKTSMPTAREDEAAAPRLGADGQIYVFGGGDSNGLLSTVEAYSLGAYAVDSGASVVTDPALVVSALSIAPLQGSLFTGAVATFLDPGGAETPDSYAASIDWGDGSTTSGNITPSGNSFTVTGSHTYRPGQISAFLRVTVTGGDNPSGVGAAPVVWMPVVSVLAIHPKEGLLFNGPVATFTDPAGGPPSNYVASINWGDGSPITAGTITLSGGTFTVSGSHTYSEEGAPILQVTAGTGDVWTSKAAMPTARRGVAAATGPDGLIYVFGGADASTIPVSTVEAYNPATDSWTTKAPMPTPRQYPAAALGADGLIYVFGGFYGYANQYQYLD
jgi:hypothetical protein